MKIERITLVDIDGKQAVIHARYVAEEYSGKRAVKAKYMGGGSFGRAVAVTLEDGYSFVVKLLCASGMLEKETHDLRLLSFRCPVKMPKPLFVREADEKVIVDCYGMDKIDGGSAIFSRKLLLGSKRRREEFADKVTDALHEIHQCTSDKYGDTLSPDCDTWLDYYKPFAAAVLERAEEMYSNQELPQEIIKVMRAAWDKFDNIFCEEVSEACLIHGDLNVANIMVDKGRLSGFIDPLNSMYADREYDLFQFDNLLKKRFNLRSVYMKKYGASANCDYKCAFYGLWNEVYCYIKSGMLVKMIMNPLIDNMYAMLARL